jgi:hypothetical protein
MAGAPFFYQHFTYMTVIVRVRKSPLPQKKWRAEFPNRHVDFGRRGYSDYTIHKDHARMLRYLVRHRARENWTSAGRYTPGFWSRWFLWSRPSLTGARLATQSALGKGYRVVL